MVSLIKSRYTIDNQESTEWGHGPINNQVSTEWGHGPINNHASTE